MHKLTKLEKGRNLYLPKSIILEKQQTPKTEMYTANRFCGSRCPYEVRLQPGSSRVGSLPRKAYGCETPEIEFTGTSAVKCIRIRSPPADKGS